ncbi:glyoxalase 1 [Brevipalpus obovatus]|uniref:glyoxalase 1 n=1 Tax=Brevipalpus obovatus TaxID=246614 RepID=UPI003D9EE453
MSATRALHFCLKIGNRPKSIRFYRDILGMTVLRHEEFDEGCAATCNGPYQNAWSKTMIGYGPENDNFILELTYNYPIPSYKIGNDIRNLVIESTEGLEKIKQEYGLNSGKDEVCLEDPDGYPLIIRRGENRLSQVSLNVKNLANSLNFWENYLAFKSTQVDGKSASIKFDHTGFILNLVEIGQTIDHAKGWGRIAFAAPLARVIRINESVKNLPGKHILHPLVELGTPGKATVTVVILLDSDGYEICFVGDENYKELSKPDANANELLEKALAEESEIWEKKKGGRSSIAEKFPTEV